METLGGLWKLFAEYVTVPIGLAAMAAVIFFAFQERFRMWLEKRSDSYKLLRRIYREVSINLRPPNSHSRAFGARVIDEIISSSADEIPSKVSEYASKLTEFDDESWKRLAKCVKWEMRKKEAFWFLPS